MLRELEHQATLAFLGMTDFKVSLVTPASLALMVLQASQEPQEPGPRAILASPEPKAQQVNLASQVLMVSSEATALQATLAFLGMTDFKVSLVTPASLALMVLQATLASAGPQAIAASPEPLDTQEHRAILALTEP